MSSYKPFDPTSKKPAVFLKELLPALRSVGWRRNDASDLVAQFVQSEYGIVSVTWSDTHKRLAFTFTRMGTTTECTIERKDAPATFDLIEAHANALGSGS